MSETFLIQQRIQQDIITSAQMYSNKAPLILARFHENPSSWNQAIPRGQTDKLTDRRDKANCRFLQLCECA